MTRAIPSWDIVNRLVKYLAKKQLSGDPATLKQASWRVGLGAEQIQKLLADEGVEIHLTYLETKRTTKNTVIRLMSIPDQLAFDTGLSKTEIEANFVIFAIAETVETMAKKAEAIEKERFFLSS